LAGLLNNKWVRRLALWVLAPVALIYGWYQINYPTCTFRYKLTAEVMTPEGLKSGSSVIEVSYSSGHPIPNPGRWSADTVTGEAVYVDLGGGKNLFVLLGTDKWKRLASRKPGREESIDGIDGGNDAIVEKNLGEGSLNVLWMPVHIYKLGRKPGNERQMQNRADALLGQPSIQVPFKNLPLIGSFSDLSKPDSFEALVPNEINKVLGDGYVLQSVKIQIVTETPVEKVSLVLPWLGKLVGGLREPPDRMKPDMRASIGQTYFKSYGYGLEI
jgi:hypothetical protein